MFGDINLALLNKRQKKIEHNEMSNVRGGVAGCECHMECGSQPLHHQGFYEGNSWVEIPGEGCPCGSIFVIFGLAWG